MIVCMLFNLLFPISQDLHFIVCLQCDGISRLLEIEVEKGIKKKFKSYPIGYIHIDIAEVYTQEGKLYLMVAIDRVTKFAYVEASPQAIKVIMPNFCNQETIRIVRNSFAIDE